MPCWEVNTMSVEFKARNFKLLQQALTELKISFSCYKDERISFRHQGNSYNINLKTQTVTFEGNNKAGWEFVNKLKRTYSTVVVKEAAKKNKWSVRNLKQNKFQLVRY